MNGKNLCLGILVYLLLSANFVAAAKVTVVRIGTGNGEVEGEGFYCGYTCQNEFPENTVLQLKAIPEEGSRFIEWLVNGVKHEGTLRVNNEEMIVSARFEKLEWVLPEFAVWWYEGNEVFVELMALDEIVVHFDEQQLQEEEQLQQAIEMVKQQFTTPVEIRDVEDFEDFWVWFQIPAIRSFEEFKAISQRLKQLPLVKQVSPVLYNDLDDREDWMIPTGKIYIQYPESFTETQIAFFEAKHNLVRVVEQFSETFTYYWVESPLETFEYSRQSYESGLLLYAAPVLMHPVSLLDDESLKQNDLFLDAQWNFRGESEHGGNVFEAWTLTQNDLQIKGNGVTIGIVEPGGVYVDHEDLLENVNHEKSSKLNKIKKLITVQKLPPDKSQKYHGASHGTATAGIAAGRGENGIGISGVAPHATIIAYRSSSTAEDALTIHQADVDIYSNSWAESTFLYRPGVVKIDTTMQTGAERKNGKNNIFVWAAGNKREKGGNANYYAYANSRYAITVAASGVAGHYDSYSNPGANVLINAPVPSCTTDLPGDEGYNPIYDNSPPIIGVYALTSYSFEQLQQEHMPDDIIQQLQSIQNKEFYLKETFLAVIQQQIGEEQCKKYQERLLYHAYHSEKFRVDGQGEFENKNYTRSFAGTSAAAPFVTGVIALMRQANPRLTYRDVRAILLQTAFRNQYDDPGYTGWEKRGVYPFSHDYGFGRVNAKAAVQTALTWKNLQKVRESPVIANYKDSTSIPENEQGIPLPIDVEQDILIEFIEIIFNANHPRWSDLEIVLTSPSETTSILAESHEVGKFDGNYGYNEGGGWRFGSVRHFGEHSKGRWTLTVKDTRPKETGTFKSVELKLYGTELVTPPYVKAVKAFLAPEQAAYHSGWTLKDGQLTWTEFTPPSALPSDVPFTLQVTASQPMKSMSVRSPGRPTP